MDGTTALVTAVSPDADALRTLAYLVAVEGEDVRATVESMTGARFIHDQLELAGWDVLIADGQRVRGLAPLAAKTDKIDAHVLAVIHLEVTQHGAAPASPDRRSEDGTIILTGRNGTGMKNDECIVSITTRGGAAQQFGKIGGQWRQRSSRG